MYTKPWQPDLGKGVLSHLGFNIFNFLFFFPWARFHHLVVTQMKIGDQAFSQDIMQSDTQKGSYKDVLMIPKVFFILAQHWFKPSLSTYF